MKYLWLILLFSLTAGAENQRFDSDPLTTEMTKAATSFITSLDETQRSAAQFPVDSNQRTNWGFVPRAREGLAIKDMSPSQVELVRKLLQSALSNLGIEKVDTIIALEGFLGEIENRKAYRDPAAYYISIFGEPSQNTTWGWRFEGHHISLNYTVSEGKVVSVTPSFLAANPAEVRVDHPMKGTRPLAAEEDLARLLAVLLDQAGKSVVFSKEPPADILTGENRQFQMLEPVGVSTTEMTQAQKKALMKLISEFAARHREPLAKSELREIENDFDKLHFGWAGGLTHGAPFYYRIQGTTFLVEAANVQNGANHIHTVWRDLEGDFGRDVLKDHIRHHH